MPCTRKEPWLLLTRDCHVDCTRICFSSHCRKIECRQVFIIRFILIGNSIKIAKKYYFCWHMTVSRPFPGEVLHWAEPIAMKMIFYSHPANETRKGFALSLVGYQQCIITLLCCLWNAMFLPLNQSLKEQKLLDSIDHELTGRPSRLYTYFSLTWKFIRPLFKLFLYQSML